MITVKDQFYIVGGANVRASAAEFTGPKGTVVIAASVNGLGYYQNSVTWRPGATASAGTTLGVRQLVKAASLEAMQAKIDAKLAGQGYVRAGDWQPLVPTTIPGEHPSFPVNVGAIAP